MPFAAKPLELMSRLAVYTTTQPQLSVASARAIGAGICVEKALRDAAMPARTRRTRPHVSWHEAGTGPALVLLNGFTASGLAWPTSWVSKLEQHYRVIRIDNRGTGWSRKAPAPFTIADLADDVQDVLQACGISEAVVMGLSMGGLIAQEFAIRHPQSVTQLVLIATAPPLPARAATGDYSALVGMALGKPPSDDSAPSPSKAFRAGQMWMQFAGPDFRPDPRITEEMGQQMLRRPTPWLSTIHQGRAFGSWWNPQRITRISAPTTVIHGHADPILPIENARRLARLIPGAQLVELPHAGHLIPWEAERELLRITGIQDD